MGKVLGEGSLNQIWVFGRSLPHKFTQLMSGNQNNNTVSRPRSHINVPFGLQSHLLGDNPWRQWAPRYDVPLPCRLLPHNPAIRPPAPQSYALYVTDASFLKSVVYF